MAEQIPEQVPEIPQAPLGAQPPEGPQPPESPAADTLQSHAEAEAFTNPAIATPGVQPLQYLPEQQYRQAQQEAMGEQAGAEVQELSGGGKAAYFVLGFMLGVFGVLLAWIMGRRRPAPLRGTRYAAYGWILSVALAAIMYGSGIVKVPTM